MEFIVIPELYGNQSWKLTAASKNSYNKIIFLGNYLNFHGTYPRNSNVLVKNFEDLIKFASQNKDKVELLIGWNDLHYLWPSEFPTTRRVYTRYDDVVKLFKNNLSLFKTCYTYRDYLFCNGLITRDWYDSVKDKAHHLLNNSYVSLEYTLNGMLNYASTRKLLSQEGYDSLRNNRDFAGPLGTKKSDLYSTPISGFKQVINGPYISEDIIKLDVFSNLKLQNTELYLCNTSNNDDNTLKKFLRINI